MYPNVPKDIERYKEVPKWIKRYQNVSKCTKIALITILYYEPFYVIFPKYEANSVFNCKAEFIIFYVRYVIL